MSTSSKHRAFHITLALLAIGVLAPIPIGDWLDGIVRQLITPVSEPVAKLTVMIRTPRTPFSESSPEVARLQGELAQTRTETRRLEAVVSELRRQLSEYQSQSDERVRPLRAERAGGATAGAARSFLINVGSRAGVEMGVAATFGGYQLVGRVTEVDLLTSIVTPITEPSDETAVCKVVILHGDTTMETGAQGAIEPNEDGELRGLFGRTIPIAVGDEVRLYDPSWGEINFGLLIGTVVDVRLHDDEPHFNQIMVKPEIAVDRVKVVMLRLPKIDEFESAEGSDG